MALGLGNGFNLQSSRSAGDFRPETKYLIDLEAASVDPNITFTRASDRSYFDVNGVLQYATTDVWPLEFDPATGECLGRSVWAAATNLLLRSEEFDNAYWTKTRCSVTADTTVAPDGATTMDTITATSTDANGMPCTSTAVTFSGATLTLSLFAKKGTGDYLIAIVYDGGSNGARHWFNLATGAVGSSTTFGTGWSKSAASIVDCGGGFYRCIFTVNTTGTNARAIIYPSTPSNSAFSCTSGDVGYPWGAQLEAGSLATPYIPTTSATVTRAADSAVVSTLSSIGFNATEGTLVVRGSAPSASGTRALATVSDGTNNERLLIYQSVSNIYFQSRDGGVTQADINSGAVTASAAMAVAVVYKANDFAASLKGAAAVANTSGTLPTVDRLVIGADGAGTALQWNSYISSILYIPRRMTNTELAGWSTL